MKGLRLVGRKLRDCNNVDSKIISINEVAQGVPPLIFNRQILLGFQDMPDFRKSKRISYQRFQILTSYIAWHTEKTAARCKLTPLISCRISEVRKLDASSIVKSTNTFVLDRFIVSALRKVSYKTRGSIVQRDAQYSFSNIPL